MLRAILRNLILALVVGLPSLIVTAVFTAWLVPPTWAGPGGIPVSATGFAAGFAFWYVLLALPAVAFALVHQALVALLLVCTERVSQRTYSVVVAFGLSLFVGAYVGITASDVHWPGLIGTLAISSAAYGFVARPLPTRERVRAPAG